MRWSVLLVAAIVLSLGSAQTHAQWWPGSYHASTAEESIANGFANVIRSAGQANLLNAHAATEGEAARKAYLENRLQATETYFEMRRMNEEYRQQLRSKPLSHEQYVRLAKTAAPSRMSPSDYDSFNGKIYWPPQLLGDEYAEYRQRLDDLFRQRALGYVQTYGDIKATCEQFLAVLQHDIKSFAPNDYVIAKNFIDSLTYEVSFPIR